LAYCAYTAYHRTAETASLKAAFNLSPVESSMFDQCMSDMLRKTLNNGGKTENFCGCFARRTSTNLSEADKSLASNFLRSLGSTPEMVHDAILPADSSTDPAKAMAILSATEDCVYEARPAGSDEANQKILKMKELTQAQRDELRRKMISRGALRE